MSILNTLNMHMLNKFTTKFALLLTWLFYMYY